MRIAILSNTFPPDGRGGAERIAWLQADGFGVLGHEVRVYTPTRVDAWSSESLHGVEIERFSSQFGRLSEMSAAHRLAYHMFSDRKPRRDVAERIKAWKPDVLLTHNLTGCGLGTASLVQSNGVRWIHTLHDIQLTDPSGQETVAWSKSAQARVWRAFWSAWRREAFGRPDVVVSPTRWLLDWHREHGFFRTDMARTVTIMPNPVEPGRDRERVFRRPATLAYIGRLSRDKGFDVLLELIPLLPPSLVDRIVAVGEGPLMDKAMALGDPRLDLRGRLSPEETRRVIAEADLLLAPSRILENQQTILLEAMAEGTPVVARDTGGTKETLEGTGCLVFDPAIDSVTLAKLVVNYQSAAERSRDVSRRLRERARLHLPERYFSSLLGCLSGFERSYLNTRTLPS